MGLPKADDDGTVMCGTPALRGYSDPDADGVMGLKKAPMTCGRMTCPTCYPHWLRETTFRIVVAVEARAHVDGVRPAHVTFGPRDATASTWTDPEIQARHQRRGVRRLKAVGVTGAVLIRHAYRIRGDRWEAIQAAGWTGKKWDAVRADVLNLGGWNHYVKPGLHTHAITVPSWLDPHTQADFVVHKIRHLPTLADTVGTVRYVLTHATTQEGHADRAVSTMGSMYDWDTEAAMDPCALLSIRVAAAHAVGMVWNDVDKRLEYPPKEAHLGEPVPPEFKPIGQLHVDMRDRAWTRQLSEDQWRFVEGVHLALMREHPRYRSWLPAVDWEGDVPPDMRVWGDVPEPMPWEVDEVDDDPPDDQVDVEPPPVLADDGPAFHLVVRRHDGHVVAVGVDR